MRGFLRLSLALVIMLSGCASKATDEEARLRTVVARYNNALAEAYKNQFFEPLKEVATYKEAKKIGIIVTSYLQANEIMEAEPKRIYFKKIDIGKDGRATVVTSEDWSYRWVDHRTREVVEPLKETHYDMLIYHLVKEDGKWLVDSVEKAED